MKLELAGYLRQLDRWPRGGRHILAQYSVESVVVYQAFNGGIGRYAAVRGRFGHGFSLDRMSWIKPNFLWMMYRSGWGTKAGQEIVLAMRLKRSAFDFMLEQAVHTMFIPQLYVTEQQWHAARNQAEVLVQWDPDHDPSGAKVERRALQLGLRGSVLARYAHDWIDDIEDISGFVATQRFFSAPDSWDQLMTPREMVYPVDDTTVAKRLGLSSV